MKLPEGLQRLPLFQTHSPLIWESLTWSKIEALQQSGTDLCLLPIGATEQHGPTCLSIMPIGRKRRSCWLLSQTPWTGLPYKTTLIEGRAKSLPGKDGNCAVGLETQPSLSQTDIGLWQSLAPKGFHG